jgi:hypothetical protein
LAAFRVHELLLSGRHYILLPKMNAAQMDALARRLTGKGFLIRRSSSIEASSPKGVIHVDPRGYCWAVFDPGDEVLPALPRLLEIPKERKPLREIMGLYFMFAKSNAKTVVKVSTRIESSTLWKALRSSADCGLTPDEYDVVSLLIKKAKGECRLLTDYPTEGSTLRIYGRKRYYESGLSPREAESTLRSIAHKSQRNSYIPREGSLTFDGFDLPSKEELADLFESLGEWCYFQPA